MTKTLMPWATFSDTEKMADAALSAKTLVAEVRARGVRVRGARRAGLRGLLQALPCSRGNRAAQR